MFAGEKKIEPCCIDQNTHDIQQFQSEAVVFELFWVWYYNTSDVWQSNFWEQLTENINNHECCIKIMFSTY